ncbi:hypothetical protein K1T71_012445, partial [Dendrolimus kikuchii]
CVYEGWQFYFHPIDSSTRKMFGIAESVGHDAAMNQNDCFHFTARVIDTMCPRLYN